MLVSLASGRKIQTREGSGPIPQCLTELLTEISPFLDTPRMHLDRHTPSGRSAPAESRVPTRDASHAFGTRREWMFAKNTERTV